MNFNVDVEFTEEEQRQIRKKYAETNITRAEMFQYCNEKYGLSFNQFNKLLKGIDKRSRILATNIDKDNRFGKDKSMRYIYKRNDRYQIARTIKGQALYFGSYSNKTIAKLVRDKLDEHNWNKNKLPEIVEAIV